VLCTDALGQGVGLVLPNLAVLDSSAVVTISRGELASDRGLAVALLALTCCSIDGHTERQVQSPAEVRKGAAEVRTSRTSPTFWSTRRARLNVAPIGKRRAHALLVGVILHVLYAEESKTLTASQKSRRSLNRFREDIADHDGD